MPRSAAWMTLCAMLIGTSSAWALEAHDRAEGPKRNGRLQPPPPAIGIQGSHKQADASTGAEGGSYEIRGTENAPLIIKAVPSDDAEAKAAEDAAERKAKAASDRWLIILTAILAVATILLVVVTGGLVWFAWRQARDMKRSIEAAETSSAAAVKALEGAETPYLVPIVSEFVEGEDTNPPSPSIIPIGSYQFENCGRSPAIILERRVDTYGTAATPNPVHWPFLNSNLYQTSILPQGRKTEKIYLTQGMFGDWTPSDQTRVAMLVGAIRYADVFGNQFITGFSFYRNARYGSWVSTGSTVHNFRRKLDGDDLRRARQRDNLTGPGAGHGFGDPEPDAEP